MHWEKQCELENIMSISKTGKEEHSSQIQQLHQANQNLDELN